MVGKYFPTIIISADVCKVHWYPASLRVWRLLGRLEPASRGQAALRRMRSSVSAASAAASFASCAHRFAFSSWGLQARGDVS